MNSKFNQANIDLAQEQHSFPNFQISKYLVHTYTHVPYVHRVINSLSMRLSLLKHCYRRIFLCPWRPQPTHSTHNNLTHIWKEKKSWTENSFPLTRWTTHGKRGKTIQAQTKIKALERKERWEPTARFPTQYRYTVRRPKKKPFEAQKRGKPGSLHLG